MNCNPAVNRRIQDHIAFILILTKTPPPPISAHDSINVAGILRDTLCAISHNEIEANFLFLGWNGI